MESTSDRRWLQTNDEWAQRGIAEKATSIHLIFHHIYFIVITFTKKNNYKKTNYYIKQKAGNKKRNKLSAILIGHYENIQSEADGDGSATEREKRIRKEKREKKKRKLHAQLLREMNFSDSEEGEIYDNFANFSKNEKFENSGEPAAVPSHPGRGRPRGRKRKTEVIIFLNSYFNF